MRMDIGARGAPALAVLLRHLIDADALLLRAIKILIERKLALARGLDEYMRHGIVGAKLGHVQRAAGTVKRVVNLLVVLGAFEIGQEVLERPAFVAKGSPMVVIPLVPADVDHRVDRARAAKRLAARLISYPAVEAGLRHRVERPIVDLRRDHDCGRGGRVDDPAGADLAGFQQANLDVRIFRQPARDDATRRPASDDNVIELVHTNSSPHKPSGDHAHSAAAGCNVPERASRAPSLSGRMKSMPMIPPTSMITPHIP